MSKQNPGASFWLAAMLSATVLLPATAARAFDDRPLALGPLSSFIGGEGNDDASGAIDFRERAPLVVPKGAELPPPRPGAPATRAANWPQDADVVRRREEAARARQPSQIEVNKNPALDKRELLQGRSDDKPVAVNICDKYVNGVPDCEPTPMEKLKQVFTLNSGNTRSEIVEVGKEPERGYLTEPPKGYRNPTQTVKATSDRPYERPDDSDAGKYYRDEAKRNSDYR